MKIAINIGHSGTSPGAIDGIDSSEDDTRYSREESDNNRLGGALSVLFSIGGNDVHLFQQQGSETLRSIAERINIIRPDLMISLHRNSVSRVGATGWSVWYHDPEDFSKALAERIAEELYAVPAVWPDAAGAVRSDFEVYPPNDGFPGGFAILRHTTVPAVLFEFGFLSNPIDERWPDSASTLYYVGLSLKNGMKKFLGEL